MRPLFVAGAILLSGCASALGPSSPGSLSSAVNERSAQAVSPAATHAPKVYSVATTCGITGCNAAVYLNGISPGTLEYTDGIAYFQPTNFAGTVTFLGRYYPDFSGAFTPNGTIVINGLTYYAWDIAGTFWRGKDALNESFAVRGHSGRGGGETIINTGGTVVTPYYTPAPTPTPSPKPPTPKPTPD